MKKLWTKPSMKTLNENRLAEVIRAAAWSGYDDDDEEDLDSPLCYDGDFR